MRRALRAIEFLALYGGIPLIIVMVREASVFAIALWGSALIVWLAGYGIGPPPTDPAWARTLLLRFAILAPPLTLVVGLFDRSHFLDLPLHHPLVWALIMILYPALSVVPQELLYRRFLFQRYAALFPGRWALIIASATAFGFAHVIFLNPWAMLLAGIGGVLFASTYARTGSLRACSIEHALYGCLVFTIGLGRFFYTGTAWHH